jgi:integrase
MHEMGRDASYALSSLVQRRQWQRWYGVRRWKWLRLAPGTSLRALAEYLGHADSGFTLRIYTHLMPTSQDRARQAMDARTGANAKG